MGKLKVLRGQVDRVGISNEHLGQLTKAYEGVAGPRADQVHPGRDRLADQRLKSPAYPIWIPSHVRNALTAGTNNVHRVHRLRDDLDEFQVMTDRRPKESPRLAPGDVGMGTWNARSSAD